MKRIDSNVRILPNVSFGKDAMIEPFVIIGEQPLGKLDSNPSTIIGDNSLIRSHTVIYAGNVIGNNFCTGHCVLIRENNEIGNNVSIGSHSVIEHHVKIGNGVRIHSQVFIPEFSVLEDNCWIGPNVVLTNARYPLSLNVKKNLEGPIIRSGAKIGANATLLPGVVVGRNSLVGAGSVVVNDIPDGKIVIGNPAKVLKNIIDLDVYLMSENL